MLVSACTFQQPFSNQLLLRSRWRHAVDKLLNITGKLPLTNGMKSVGNCLPSRFDFPACVDEGTFPGFGS